MKDYLKFFWFVPAIAFLIPLLMIIIMATAPPGGLGAAAGNIYEEVFYITPAVGVVVLFTLLVLLIIQRTLLKQIHVGRTIAFALLDVISPLVFLFLGMVLSGFLR